MGCFCPPHCLFLCTQWAYSFNEMWISTSSLSALSCSAGCSFSSFHTFTIWDLKKADLLSQFLFLALSSLSTSISPTLFQLHTAKGFWTPLEQYSCLLVPAILSTSQVYTETLFPISAVTQMTLRPRTWRRFTILFTNPADLLPKDSQIARSQSHYCNSIPSWAFINYQHYITVY